MNAIIYGTRNCRICEQVVRSLKKHTTSVTRIDVSADNPENLEEMKKFAGEDAKTVPQVVIDGKHIGGYTETERYLNIVSLRSITGS